MQFLYHPNLISMKKSLYPTLAYLPLFQSLSLHCHITDNVHTCTLISQNLLYFSVINVMGMYIYF